MNCSVKSLWLVSYDAWYDILISWHSSIYSLIEYWTFTYLFLEQMFLNKYSFFETNRCSDLLKIEWEDRILHISNCHFLFCSDRWVSLFWNHTIQVTWASRSAEWVLEWVMSELSSKLSDQMSSWWVLIEQQEFKSVHNKLLMKFWMSFKQNRLLILMYSCSVSHFFILWWCWFYFAHTAFSFWFSDS